MALDKRSRQKLEAELAVLLKKGRLQRAALVMRTLVEADPEDDRLFVRLAEVSLKLNDEAGARAAFRGAATAAERKGFYLRAMAALRQLARYQPPHERPWNELAGLAYRLGLVADALGFLDEGARAWDAAGDKAAVLAAARKAHELAPDDVHRTLRLARELRAAEDRVGSMALLAAEAERHRAAGRRDAWLELADAHSALEPTERVLACAVAEAHLERGEPRRALQRLQGLLRGKAHHVESLRLLVRTFEVLGQSEKRRTALRELARAVAARGREAEATPYWRQLLDADPNDREARVALGLPPPEVPRSAPAATPPPARPAPPAPPAPEALPFMAMPAAAPPIVVAAAPGAAPIAPAAATPPAPAPPPAAQEDDEEVISLLHDAEEEEVIDLAGDSVVVEDEAPPLILVPAAPPPAVLGPPAPAPAPASPPLAAAARVAAAPAPAAPGAMSVTPPPGSPLLAPVDLSLLDGAVEDADGLIEHADLGDELAHAEFLVAHRFEAEARELLEDLAVEHPGHPGVEALSARLASGPERIAANPAPGADPAMVSAVPAAARALGPATPAPRVAPSDGVLDPADLDTLSLDVVGLIPAEEVLARFREGVAVAVGPGDSATHYDLGIAYREMGLLFEAHAEFEQALASASGPRAVDCMVGMALCDAGQGDHGRAARTLEQLLAGDELTPAAAAAVCYELGAVREAAGDARGAARAYASAERVVPRFRDAAQRAGRLHPPGAASDRDDPGTLGLLPSGA